MSKLTELLTELCPDGVDYRLLNDTCVIKRGIRVVRSQLKLEGTIPVYQNSLTPMGYHESSNCPANSSFIIAAGAAGDVGYSQVPFWAADDCFYFDCPESLLERFLYYVLSSNQEYIYSKVRKASIPRLARNFIEDLKIPVPPLPVQSEIVQILDNFTELTAELTARRKQYQYYLDTLLSGCDNVPKLSLSECCITIADGDHQPPPKTDSGIPFITISNINSYKKIDFNNTMFVAQNYYDALDSKRKAQAGDILYTVVGSYGTPVYIDKNYKFVFQRHIAILRPNEKQIIPKFLYYAMQSSAFYRQAELAAVGAAQKTISLSSLNKMKVPVPSISEQAHIISIVDRFNALCNDLTSGLPAEIEARQKQYEYYRDKLLTFKEKEA